MGGDTREHRGLGREACGRTRGSAPASSPPGHRRRTERVVAAFTLLLVVAVWLLGAMRTDEDLLPFVRQAMPEAGHVIREDDGLYAAWAGEGENTLLGYVAIGTAGGYGGPLLVVVAVDPAGQIVGTAIANHKETSVWMERVRSSRLLASLTGKSYSEPFAIGADLDGVTGATHTSQAIAQAVLAGSRAAARRLGLPVEPLPPPKIVFGIPELVLLALFAVGYLGHQRSFPYRRQVRWLTLLVGLVVLGFLYNAPVTLAYITKLLLGYWPQWQTNLYWYFLLGGTLLVFMVDNKNPYCDWFCPFGAAQECMGAIGGAKPLGSNRYRELLLWLQRGFALTAVLLGIFFRSPGLASYELFGTLFTLVGTSLQLAALGLVLIAALFIARPWCTYLCPIRAVVDLIRVVRGMVKDLWTKRTPRADAA